MKTTIKKILNRLTRRENIGTDLPSFRRIDLRKVSPLSVKMEDNFLLGPGDSPYQLYAFLSTLFNDKIILDIGSQCGNSALALSYNERNHVRSYETDSGQEEVQYCQHTIHKDNIIWKDYDFRDDEDRDGVCAIDYNKVALILIDIDPHGWKDEDGKTVELKMIEFLLEKEWTGVIILDDIYKGCQMEDFWNELSIPGWTKIDVSELGHSSGTGILFPS